MTTKKIRFQKQYTLTVDTDGNVIAAMLETETEYKRVNLYKWFNSENAYVKQNKVNLHTLRGGVANGNYKLI